MNGDSDSNDCVDGPRDSLQPAATAALERPTDESSIARIEEGRLAEETVGSSTEWREVLKRAARVAATETTACVHGESGTGKEVVARYIHHLSPRRRGPFVALNCAALPEQLLESELFGYRARGLHRRGPVQTGPGRARGRRRVVSR